MPVESTIVHISDGQVANIPYAARSISLSVKAGTVSAVIGGAAAVVVTAGMSHTWSVDGPDEILTDGFTFTGGTPADAYVTITRE